MLSQHNKSLSDLRPQVLSILQSPLLRHNGAKGITRDSGDDNIIERLLFIGLQLQKRAHGGEGERKYDSSPKGTAGDDDSPEIGVGKRVSIPDGGHGDDDIPPGVPHVVEVHIGLHHGSFEDPHDEPEHDDGRNQEQGEQHDQWLSVHIALNSEVGGDPDAVLLADAHGDGVEVLAVVEHAGDEQVDPQVHHGVENLRHVVADPDHLVVDLLRHGHREVHPGVGEEQQHENRQRHLVAQVLHRSEGLAQVQVLHQRVLDHRRQVLEGLRVVPLPLEVVHAVSDHQHYRNYAHYQGKHSPLH